MFFGGRLSSIVRAAVSLFGGVSGKKTAARVQQAQIDHLNKALAEQRRQFDITRSDFAPYLKTGLAGLGDLGDLIGVNGADAQSAGLVNIQNSPELAAIIRNGEAAEIGRESCRESVCQYV